jgi:hypothetical protein
MFWACKEIKPTSHLSSCDFCKKPIIKGQKYIKFDTKNDFKNYDTLRFCKKSCLSKYILKEVE